AISEQVDTQLQSEVPFRWDQVSNDFLWNVVMQSDSLLVVGYKPSEVSDVDVRLHEINVQDDRWSSAVSRIKQNIQRTYDDLGAGLDVEEEVQHVHETLPYLHLRVRRVETIDRLRELPEVRYLEPATYEPIDGSLASSLRVESKLGCSNEPESIPSEDFTTIAPLSKVPWNFNPMNIPAAWDRATGRSIGIAIIDTGTSSAQDKLNAGFTDGFPGRYRQTFGTYVSSIWPWARPDGPNDRCGHGTQMAGSAVSPRNADGAIVGVAYESNLIGIRGTKDVVITSGREKNGVSDALVLAAKRSDVKIISMSIGTPFYSSQVADAVRYAYGKGKMIFAAAGTSTSFTRFVGVVFPASMNETLAVTGITDDEGYELCNNCHGGRKVDFVAVVQRKGSSSRVSLTLAESGDQPSRVGGSSVATAMTSGVAALIWSTDLSQSRDQVLTRMKQSAELFPDRRRDFGWGLIDASQAVQ
ncbi:MAG: S8/S53 family peptidase, partial [Bacteroidota bacterium]